MERKATFDLIAGEYDKYWPTYPEILFDDLLVYSGIAPSADIFEIGCGTGQATSSLVKKGFTNITCVELGKNLARIASNKFQDHPNIRIINTSFENWKAADSSFDLAISATAFHFIDQEYGYKKVKRILKPLGTLGFFWTIHVPCFDPIHNEIRKIYQRYAPDLDDSKKPRPEETINTRRRLMENHGFFENIVVKEYRWMHTYTGADYVFLLNTHSKHQQLETRVRKKLFNEIKSLIDGKGGFINKPQMVVLFLARKSC